MEGPVTMLLNVSTVHSYRGHLPVTAGNIVL